MSDKAAKTETASTEANAPSLVQGKEYKHIQSIVTHIRNVQINAERLAECVIELGELDFGRQLIANSLIHDNSKFHGIEWEYLTNGQEDKAKLAIAVRQHVTTNPHHPEFIEYEGDIRNMPRIYVAEMVCDWKARSTEFGTGVREWIRDCAMKKYSISSNMKVYKQIKEFTDLLCETPFKAIRS